MKQAMRILCFALAFLCLTGSFSMADVPNYLNHQGQLSDSTGPVADGTYLMQFAVFQTASTTTELWSEIHEVEVVDGIYTVLLGSIDYKNNPFDINTFSGGDGCYLEVRICPPDNLTCNPEKGEMEIFSPRQRLTTTPYAFKADEAGHAADADTLGGIAPSGFIRPNQAGVISNVMITAGAVDNSNIAAYAVTSSKIAEGNVSSSHIANGSIKGGLTGDIATETINVFNLADGAVQTSKIDDNAVTTDKIQDGAVTAAKITPGYVADFDADLLDGQHAADIIDAASDEVRTPISSLPYYISSPGSYYLTGNLTVTSTKDVYAIYIASSNVTIDFMGFTITQVAGGAAAGISAGSYALENITIKNGAISGFSSSGISLWYASGGRVENMQITDNVDYGILIGTRSIVKNNIVRGSGNHGIMAGRGSLVDQNVVGDGLDRGIYGADTAITNNVVMNNGTDGIYGADGCNIIGNTVVENNQEASGAYAGIRVSNQCLVKGNRVVNNKVWGIYIPANSGNNVRNCIEENYVAGIGTGAGAGIKILEEGTEDGRNLYLNNRVSGCDPDLSIITGNINGGGNITY